MTFFLFDFDVCTDSIFFATLTLLFYIKLTFMQILTQPIPLEKVKTDFLVVNTFANETKPGGGTGAVDKKLKNAITKKIKSIYFTGKTAGEFFMLDAHSGGAKQVMVISLGERKNFNLEIVRKVSAISLLEAKKQNAKTIATILHGAGNGKLAPMNCAQSLTEGLLLADYHFNKYLSEGKKENQKKKIGKVIVCQKRKEKIADIKKGIALGINSAYAQNFTRNMVNEPPRSMPPKTLAEIAKTIAKENKFITTQILNKKQVEQLGMEAYLAVDEGSTKDLAFIHLTYKPTPAKKKIALVGKSVTFDSGGLSLKPSDSMMTMKMDMAGGAVVLGVFSALNSLKPDLEIHGILPACENMPSGSAMKVDDVVTASNGTTIEIANTDAEGRLTLADGLVYAEKLNPDVIIDLATLTGAAVVALGNEIAALMTDDDELKNKLISASEITGEKIWQLPLDQIYEPHIKSEIADIKNVGRKYYAGTITAGLFLKHFVKKTPWAHLDIAGPAWTDARTVPYLPSGGSGFGVRLLLEYLKNL